MLVSAIAATASVTECKLRGNELGVEVWTIIFNTLRDSPTSKIATWDLLGEKLGPEIAKPLAEYISVTTSLTELNLFENNMGEDGGLAIAKALKSNRSLLTLKSNYLGARGAKAMEEALKVNNVLKTLEAPSNGIDDEGAKALAEGLFVNASVTELNLNDNNIGAEGAKALAASLAANSFRMNSSVTRLDVRANWLDEVGRASLREAIEGRSGFLLLL